MCQASHKQTAQWPSSFFQVDCCVWRNKVASSTSSASLCQELQSPNLTKANQVQLDLNGVNYSTGNHAAWNYTLGSHTLTVTAFNTIDGRASPPCTVSFYYCRFKFRSSSCASAPILQRSIFWENDQHRKGERERENGSLFINPEHRSGVSWENLQGTR
jgi:hypothetical protein